MTLQLTPSNWMQLLNCTTWYPTRVMVSLSLLLSLKYLLLAIQMYMQQCPCTSWVSDVVKAQCMDPETIASHHDELNSYRFLP